MEDIHELYGSEEEENNISEISRLMNMNYEVEATQFIQPPEMRKMEGTCILPCYV
jgi:hypothetical protein